MKDDNEIILTIGNTDLKITNDGQIQVRANQGTASIERGNVKRGKNAIEHFSAFTTTSTTWIEITGLSLTRKQKSILKKLKSIIIDNREDWYRIASLILQGYSHG